MLKDKLELVEDVTEKFLFTSRWLMAPIYLGLASTLVVLLVFFLKKLWFFFTAIFTLTESDTILTILALIDLSLAGNLILIVIFSGYENFVSKINTEDHKDHPNWKKSIDFSSLKLKLVASIVAISGIHLLKVFMNIKQYEQFDVLWMVIIHLTFVISGVLLAVMDRVAASSKKINKADS